MDLQRRKCIMGSSHGHVRHAGIDVILGSGVVDVSQRTRLGERILDGGESYFGTTERAFQSRLDFGRNGQVLWN